MAAPYRQTSSRPTVRRGQLPAKSPRHLTLRRTIAKSKSGTLTARPSPGLTTACPRRGYRLCGVVWSGARDRTSSARHPRRSPHWHDRFEVFARTANSQLCVSNFLRPATGPQAEPTPPIFSRSPRLPDAGSFPTYIDEIAGWARLEPHPHGTRRGAR
jgi:hypothetical protein